MQGKMNKGRFIKLIHIARLNLRFATKIIGQSLKAYRVKVRAKSGEFDRHNGGYARSKFTDVNLR